MKFWRCGFCDVKFEVHPPRYGANTSRLAHFTKCSCGLRFWHGSRVSPDHSHGWATAGVRPEDLAEHKPNAEVLG